MRHLVPRALVALPLLLLAACAQSTDVPPAPSADGPAPIAGETPAAETPPAPAPAVVDPRITTYRDHENVRDALTDAGRAVLEAPDGVTLYSVDPEHHADYGYGGRTEPSPFTNALDDLAAGRGVLGSLALPTGAPTAAVTGRVYAGLVEEGPQAHCYIPRHALVYAKGDARVVVYICFSCSYAVVLESTTAKGGYRGFQDVGELKADLNRRLADAGIALAD